MATQAIGDIKKHLRDLAKGSSEQEAAVLFELSNFANEKFFDRFEYYLTRANAIGGWSPQNAQALQTMQPATTALNRDLHAGISAPKGSISEVLTTSPQRVLVTPAIGREV